MSIRAICTASLLFFDPNDKSKAQVIAPMLQIVELPEWVKNTATFQVNLKCGRIRIMNDGTTQKAVEQIQEKAQDLTARQQSETLEEELANMKNAELKEYCKAHNLEYKAKAKNSELISIIKANSANK